MAESRLRIGTEGALSPDDVARRGFATVRRGGYDPIDVRAFLEAVANELRRLRARIEDLDPANMPPAAASPVPSVDIAMLTTALGEETARVLRTAQEAAHDLRARAEEGASRALAEAHEEAARLRSEAETLLADRTAEADQMAAKLRAEVDAEIAGLRAGLAIDLETARAAATAEAEAAIAAAVDKGREMVTEAQAARERMLTDLARRRKAALIQLEQLRAGRDRLLEAYGQVRLSLDEVTGQLEAADEDARHAADAAARRAASLPSDALEAEPTPPAGVSATAATAATPETPASAAAVGAGPADEASANRTADAGRAPSASRTADEARSATPTGKGKRGRAARRLHGAAEGSPVASLPASTVGEQVPAASAGADVSARADGSAVPDGSAPAEAETSPEKAAAAEGGDAAAEVDDLFARIRADRAETSASEPVAEPEPGQTERGQTAAPTAGDADASAPPGVDQTGASDLEVARSNDDEVWLHRRDEMLEPITATLNRKIKRLFQDEQNLVLDRLRTHRGSITTEELLPDPLAHPGPYLAAALVGLGEAEKAGVALAAAVGPVSDPAPAEPDAEALRALAMAMATELLEPLRARLARSLTDVGSDQATASDAINTAYRELKSARIDRAVGDQLTAAVSLGLRRVLPAGTAVRWVVEDIDGPCPDCDDNALAGTTPLGDEFPTGQVAPPAHPGCRCLLGPPAA